MKKLSINGLLLAFIISLNAIKSFLHVYNLNILIYLIYGLFILCTILNHRKDNFFKYDKKTGIVLVLLGILTIISLITGIFLGNYEEAFKFLIYYIMMICIFKLDLKDVFSALVCSVAIISLYSLIIILNFEFIKPYYRATNYLVVTLPIGLALSIALIDFVAFLYKKKIKLSLIFLVSSAINFSALLHFPARGSLLIPFVVLFVFLLILLRKSLFKFIKIIVPLILVLIIAFNVFLTNMNKYGLYRMIKLFEDSQDESRWDVWNNYLEEGISNGWFILGGGTAVSESELGYYPHNVYLQLMGDFGLLGIIVSLYITLLCLLSQIKIYRENEIFEDEKKFNLSIVVFSISAGLLYAYLNFMKSFSIYDGSMLYIFVALVFRINSINNRMEQK